MTQKVRFNWPSSDLSPNSRGHWSKKAKAAKQYRRDCFMLARLESLSVDGWLGRIDLSIKFCPPDARRRDLDNVLASIKSGFDGLADALGVNDYRFRLSASLGDPVRLGAVLVTIEEQ